MTSDKALYNFFSSFGISAYASSSVPNDVVFPYLTFDLVIGTFGEQTSLTCNLWYYTESEALPNAKAREIYDALGKGGKLLPCDGGAVWLKRGSPWCQSLKDDNNDKIKRRYINITAEYLID